MVKAWYSVHAVLELNYLFSKHDQTFLSNSVGYDKAVSSSSPVFLVHLAEKKWLAHKKIVKAFVSLLYSLVLHRLSRVCEL